MQLNFVTVDVFTDRRFGGNPLAVVLNGDGLTTEQMQSIAAEFNLAETTFVLPPRDPSHTHEVRIFTPRAELPFAGHPNIGTAFVVATSGSGHERVVRDTVTFEEKAGLVRLDLVKDGNSVVGARLAAPQPLTMGDDVSPDVAARACSISVTDIETNNHAPCIVSCGVPFVPRMLRLMSAMGVKRTLRGRGRKVFLTQSGHLQLSILGYVQLLMCGSSCRTRFSNEGWISIWPL